MKLYYFPVAPNPTKVRLCLAEKGIDEIEMVRVNLGEKEQRSEEFLAKNPAGKLPVLELDDGSYLTESLAIIEYLEERYPEPTMWGDTAEKRARARQVERIADLGVLMATGRAVHATNSPLGLPAYPPIAEEARAARENGLTRVDALLANSPFLAGDRVTVGDCTLWAGLGFGAFFGLDVDPKYTNVTRWRKEFGERPSVQLPG